MLAVIDLKEGPRGRKTLHLRREELGHAGLLRAELLLPPGLRPRGRRKRLERAAAELRRMGVCRAVFPGEPWVEALLLQEGLRPLGAEGLYRRLAAPLARRALGGLGLPPEGTTLALLGEPWDPDLHQAARELAATARYLLIPGAGNGRLRQELMGDFGLAVTEDPGPERLRRADLSLLFTPVPADRLSRQAVLPLWEGDLPGVPALLGEPELLLPPDKERLWGPQCRHNRLIAAWAEAGALRPEDIRLGKHWRKRM